MKNLTLLFILTVFTFHNAFAQSKQVIGVDTLRIGNASSANDATLELAGTNVKIKGNKTTGFAEFTNDGTVWKKLGSGSGGGDAGFNILDNSSFEDGITTGFTSSGGTFSQQAYANGVESNLKYSRFIATAAGQYFETTTKAVPTFGVGGCMAKINYQSTDAASWKVDVLDGSANVLGTQSLGPREWQNAFVTFPCPATGTLVKVRVTSLLAGTINSDIFYLGAENRLLSVSQSRVSARATWAGMAASSGWRTHLSAITGTAATNDALIDTTQNAIVVKKKGDYLINSSVQVTAGSTNVGVGVSVNNVNPSGKGCIYQAISGDSGDRPCSDILSLNVGDYIRPAFYTPTSFASTGAKIELIYIPSTTDLAMTSDAADWQVDVNIGGGLATMALTSVNTYTAFGTSTLDMVINPGSAPAKIPCFNAASTGLTCSGVDEQLGVVFNNPYAGYFDVCADFGSYANSTTAGTVDIAFELIQTASNSATIIQEGRSRTINYLNLNNSTSIMPQKNCGTFFFGDVGEKTVRLMYEQLITGTVLANAVIADRSASNGQRDVRFTVRPSTQNIAKPVLVSPGVSFTAQKSGGTHSTNNVVETVSAWDAALFKESTPGVFNRTTGVFTTPVGAAGFYQANASIGFATNGGNSAYCNFLQQKSGVDYANYSVSGKSYIAGGTTTLWIGGSAGMYLDAGDTVQLKCYQNSGGAVGYAANSNVNHFSLIKTNN